MQRRPRGCRACSASSAAPTAGGEGGTTPALAAVVSAIVDALRDFGIRNIEMPATPFAVWQAIQNAKAKNSNKAMMGDQS
jgi:CO/xanthine dehydrogenase Mo-binding subunit